MDTIVIDVYLPAAERTFQIKVPKAMNSLLAAHLAAEAVAELSDGNYLASRNSVLAWKSSGRLLDVSKSLEQERVMNGSSLILV